MSSDEFDPLAALGVRLATPEGTAFLDKHFEAIADLHGRDLANDIALVLNTADADAAMRIAQKICPGATFEQSETNEDFVVAYASSFGYAPGTLSLTKSPRTSQALALVRAAINLHDARDRMGTYMSVNGNFYRIDFLDHLWAELNQKADTIWRLGLEKPSHSEKFAYDVLTSITVRKPRTAD